VASRTMAIVVNRKFQRHVKCMPRVSLLRVHIYCARLILNLSPSQLRNDQPIESQFTDHPSNAGRRIHQHSTLDRN
jgi:hypothetical protein